jgi:hypothetical protein
MSKRVTRAGRFTAIALVAVSLGACGRQSVAPTTTARDPALPNGIYVNGAPNTSLVTHYFVSLTNGANGGVSGSVDFQYEEGQVIVVFTFGGTVQNGIATLLPIAVPRNGGSASQNPGAVPSAIAAPIGHKSLFLSGCTAYLHFVEGQAQCGFAYHSPTFT